MDSPQLEQKYTLLAEGLTPWRKPHRSGTGRVRVAKLSRKSTQAFDKLDDSIELVQTTYGRHEQGKYIGCKEDYRAKGRKVTCSCE